uniref:hypothetical protein n=1 Tax=Nonomuraea pusilla TaxID=46177 RepID=UPI00128F79B7|nr:hypothetical protein [Nonomuraea pusilla]
MMIRLLSGVAAAMVAFSGTAAAYPVEGAPELTDNDLYKAAELAGTACPAKKGTSRASTEKYLRALAACLGKAWRQEPVQVEIHYDPGTRKKAHKSWPFPVPGGLYVALADDWVKAKSDAAVFYGMAAAYGEYMQIQAGITKAARSLDHHGDDKELDEQERRYSYQRACLAGAAAEALGRTPRTGAPSLKGNALHWFTQGFKAGGPGGCNTWKAPSSKVS